MICVKCRETVGPGGMLWLDDDGDPVCSTCANDSGETSKLSAALVRICELEEDVTIHNKIARIHRHTLDALRAPMASALGIDDTDTAARIRALAEAIKAEAEKNVDSHHARRAIAAEKEVMRLVVGIKEQISETPGGQEFKGLGVLGSLARSVHNACALARANGHISCEAEQLKNAYVESGVMMGVLRTLAIEVWGTKDATARLQVALYGPVIPYGQETTSS